MTFKLLKPSTLVLCALAIAWCSAGQIAAQSTPQAQTPQDNVTMQSDGLKELGQTGQTGVGKVGQRQSKDDAAPTLHPMARVDSRINNRVQNRIRNRIDQYYDPLANALTPFKAANDRMEKDKPRGN